MSNIDYFNGKTEADKKIIHLYVTSICHHHCEFCCNKQYSVNSIPVVTVDELKNAEVICLTGGEPFLIKTICDFAGNIKQQYPNIKQIFVYTCGDSLYDYLEEGRSLYNIDGVNMSPKNKYDAECVNKLLSTVHFRKQILSMWSNRLYVFPNVIDYVDTYNLWQYENIRVLDRDWQEDFKPDSGIFRRLPILLK